jgi:hypothetical protein
MLAEIVKLAAFVIPSFTAIYAIDAWLREFRGKKKYELAEEVLTLTYDCRDRLKQIRNPASYPGEVSSDAPDKTNIVLWRYDKKKEPFDRLFAIRFRFAALFGAAAAESLEHFKLAVYDLLSAAQSLTALRAVSAEYRAALKKEGLNETQEAIEKAWRTIYGIFSERDEYDAKINTIVAQVEEVCRSVLQPVPWHVRAGRVCESAKHFVLNRQSKA